MNEHRESARKLVVAKRESHAFQQALTKDEIREHFLLSISAIKSARDHMIRETYDAIKGAPGARSARVALDAFWKTERLVHDSDPLISTLFQMRDGDHHGGGPELHVAGGSRVTVAYALQAGEHAVHSDDGFWVVKNEGTPNEERFQPPQIIHKVELNSTIVGRVTPHLHRDLARDETSPASVLQLAISYFDDLWHRTRESPPLLRHFPEPDQAP